MKNTLYLGVGRKIITPKIGACLYGYRPGLESTSVNDDLTATAFYFKQGERKSLLVSVTLGGVQTDISNGIFKTVEEKYGIPHSAALMNAIHTHSAPNIVGSHGWGDIDAEYRDEIFIPNTLLAIDEAVSSAKPVTMAIAAGESKIGINRREITLENNVKLGQNPWGAYNPKMTILSFKDEDGTPVANIIHYGAHATAAGPNFEISRDWPGVMIDTLESESGAITAFVNGPEGDDRWTRTRYHQYLGYAMQDEKARKYIKGVGYQWAGKMALGATHDDYPELELIQTESECGGGDNSWAQMMYIFEMMRMYIREGASAYVYWNIALEGDSASTWGWKQNSLIHVNGNKATLTPEYYLMKHVSHFVKRGAKFVESKGIFSSNTLAFVNPDGQRILFVANPYEAEKVVTVENNSYVLPPRSLNTITL